MPRQSSAKEGNLAQLRLNQALEEDEEWTTGGDFVKITTEPQIKINGFQFIENIQNIIK